jgi:hypothetical protein
MVENPIGRPDGATASRLVGANEEFCDDSVGAVSNYVKPQALTTTRPHVTVCEPNPKSRE